MKQLLLLLIFATLLFADRNIAKQHNSAGYTLYKKGKLEEALIKFNLAYRTDSTYAQARFNGLCTASLLYDSHVCELGIYISELGKEVLKFVQTFPQWRDKVASDKDLTKVRETFGFQRAIGRNPKIDSDLVLILEAVEWYGPAPGAIGPISRVDFRGGYACFKHISMGEEFFWEEMKPMRYEVRNGEIRIYDKKGAVIKGRLSDEGKIQFDDKRRHPYTDDPDECSA